MTDWKRVAKNYRREMRAAERLWHESDKNYWDFVYSCAKALGTPAPLDLHISPYDTARLVLARLGAQCDQALGIPAVDRIGPPLETDVRALQLADMLDRGMASRDIRGGQLGRFIVRLFLPGPDRYRFTRWFNVLRWRLKRRFASKDEVASG